MNPVFFVMLVYYVIPVAITCFATYFCKKIGAPLWAPWIVLAAYVYGTQAAIISKPGQEEE